MDIILNGMTWSHRRGHAPLFACSELWRRKTGVEIRWDKRSLQDFEAYPVQELARRYDLIVIDHPHVGQVARENCLAPFDAAGPSRRQGGARSCERRPVLRELRMARAAMGAADRRGDAGAAWRPDLVASPPALWDEAVDLARRGMVLFPLRPPHSLMVLYTLSGNLGRPCSVEGPDLIDAEAGAEAFERISELAALIDARCFAMDPIDVFEAIADPDSRFACAPLIYGYVSYAEDGFRARRIGFADIPALGSNGPVGSTLGGTGIAVSALGAHEEAAADFAYWVASADVQAGLYAASGGQPAHAAAWESDAVNAPVAGFYRATRQTLEGSWLRPRHDGYMPFQDAAARLLNEALQSGSRAGETVGRINALFRASFAG